MTDIACLMREIQMGSFGASVQDWLAEGFRRHARAGGSISLETALGIPGQRQLERHERNRLLLELATLSTEPDITVRAVQLHRELKQFCRRGPWLRWGHLDAPSAEADPRQFAVWWVVRLTRDKPPSYRTICRALGIDVSGKTCARNAAAPAGDCAA